MMIQKAARIVKEHYDLGELIDAEEVLGGYCNQSFALLFEKHGRRFKYLVRRYNPKTEEKEIKFEHALVRHLKKRGFDMAADVISNKNGRTYVNEKLIGEGYATNELWAVFEYLEGEDRYSWIDTHIAQEDMISAAEVLARLHIAGHNFYKPPEADRVQPPIMDFLPTFRHVYTEFTQKAGNTNFDQFFMEHRKDILNTVDEILIPEPNLSKLPQLPIHCDYHQGNLKYQNSHVIGVFDFDWSKIDLRLFDLALALVYFSACWEGQAAGSLTLDKYRLFLQTYNRTCELTADPGPLTKLEKKYLPSLLAAGNLFVLHWTIVDFYSIENPDDAEYLKYFNHGITLMSWIEAQKDQLDHITAQTCTQK